MAVGVLRGDAFRIGALLLVVWLAYIPALRAGFIWDDDFYVSNNTTLRSGQGLGKIWLDPGATPQYYPMVFTTFWAEYHFWGLAPAGYHLTNIVLHGLNTVLVWLILRTLGVPGAWFAAALFGLHPVQVESVAWVTERKNVLSGFFYLVAMLMFFRFTPATTEGNTTESWRWYFGTLALFLLALFSKTVTCSLPAVLLLLLWWKRDRIGGREFLWLLPMFVLGACLAVVTVYLEKQHVGANGEDWSFSPVDRCLIAGRALWFYVGKLLVPASLTFIYPRWDISASQPWQFLFPIGWILGVIALWLLRTRIGKGPLVAVLIFSGTLVPALGFFDTYPMRFSFVADHFQYLASIALLAGAVACLRGLGKNGWPSCWTGWLAGSCWAATLGVWTWHQAGIYRDLATLWTDTLAKNPGCWMANYNLGHLRMEEKKYDEAIALFSRTVALNPRHADALQNVGIIHALRENFAEAEEKFQEALALYKREEHLRGQVPSFSLARLHVNLGGLRSLQGRRDDACEQYRAAVAMMPQYPEALFKLGMCCAERGDSRQALLYWDRALANNPQFAQVFFERGSYLCRIAQQEEGVRSLEKAVALQPGEYTYRMRLAEAYQQLGRLAEASAQSDVARRLAGGW